MVLDGNNRIPLSVSGNSKANARKFVDELLSPGLSRTERTETYRAFMMQTRTSPELSDTARHIYAQLAQGVIPAQDIAEAHMYISGLAQNLDLLPYVERNVELFIDCTFPPDHQIVGLWKYIRDIYLRKCFVERQQVAAPPPIQADTIRFLRIEERSEQSILWSEMRGEGDGELFFVAGTSAANAWVFQERSSFEVSWSPVQPHLIHHCLQTIRKQTAAGRLQARNPKPKTSDRSRSSGSARNSRRSVVRRKKRHSAQRTY